MIEDAQVYVSCPLICAYLLFYILYTPPVSYLFLCLIIYILFLHSRCGAPTILLHMYDDKEVLLYRCFYLEHVAEIQKACRVKTTHPLLLLFFSY